MYLLIKNEIYICPMKKIGERISYYYHEDYTTVIINGRTEAWKTNVMLIWFLAWLFSGFSVLYSLYNYEFDSDQKTFLMIFMFFWAYFLFKITRVLLWRKYGMEFIKIDNDRLTMKKSILGYGVARPFLTANVKNFKLQEVNAKSYVKVFNDSFWVIGSGTLNMITNSEEINFGSQLNNKDAKELIKLMKKIVNKYSQQES